MDDYVHMHTDMPTPDKGKSGYPWEKQILVMIIIKIRKVLFFFSEKDSTNPSLHHFNPIVIARVVWTRKDYKETKNKRKSHCTLETTKCNAE